MKFTIIAQPNHQDPEKYQDWVHFFPQYNRNSFSTRLRSDPDSLGEAEKILKARSEDINQESVLPLEVIHPKSVNHHTVRIWGSDKQPHKYFLQDPQDLDTFDTTNQDNLLYLPELHQKLRQQRKQFVEFRNNRDEKRYRYQVIEAVKLGFPNSVASKTNFVSEGFFKQVGENDGVNPEIVELDYDDVNQSEYYSCGCLNPAIFTLALDGNDIEHIHNAQDGYLKSLSLFLAPSSIIFVEPHIDEIYDLRISFLIKFNKLIQQSQTNFSLIECFLFGSQYPQAWKPFLALDLLGGKFYAWQKVYQIQEQPLIAWEPPLDIAPNAQWFANYWRQTWKNMQFIQQNQVDIVPAPPQARPYRPSKGLDTWKFSSSEEIMPLTDVLVKHPQFAQEEINPYNFLLELFQDPKLKKFNTNYGGSFPRIEGQLITFDEVKFWNDLSTNHLIPESPILISVPKQEERFFDIIKSVNLGAYKFSYNLFNYYYPREQEVIDFYNIFGWWNNWHSTIFNARWDVCLRFIERNGFIVSKSIVSKDYLGLKSNRINWKYPHMRFSVPIESNF
jgi:hypothetical protein